MTKIIPDNLLQLQSGSKGFGSRVLFQKASFSIDAGEHVGVIGPNGAGKSTLFRILIGEDSLDHGNLVRSRKLSVGYLSQHDEWNPNDTGNLFLERTTKIPMWELKRQGKVLRLDEEILEKPVLSLSGGYRMRIKLLALLGQVPNLMLLDEPTNYLDLETTLVLENFLQGYEGAFLLISHDREFLRRTTDHILEIETGDITKFNGNIDDYFEQKDLLRSQLAAKAASQADKRQQILDFVARFGAKATKARQAQSRLKSLQKMETIDIKPLPVASTIRIPAPQKTGKVIMRLEDARLGYGEKTILDKVSLNIERGDHVAVVGLNGAGKSTLLKAISGTLPALSGKFELGLGVKIAFFAQHVVEALSQEDTVLSSLEKAADKDVRPQDILDLAGSLLFSGDDIRKSISILSGGEKSRVALGRVLLQKAPCLVLDEPTNHLDFQTVEALILALRSYEGTVIVVSHDRGFVRRVATKILEVANGKVHLYPGSYEEYVWSVQKFLSNDSPKSKASSANADFDDATPKAENWRDTKKKLDRNLRTCEKKLAEVEAEIKDRTGKNEAINHKISTENNPTMDMINEMSENTLRLGQLEESWIALSEEREQLQADIQKMME